ncbi:MAG TPA: LytTR family DNA-binding domain-containing protein [Gemmatimonadales bacterium]|nr:LytTR family DNA-binding domain-containing protein [Gemmatimonadales bacterium]HZH39484.1 LytTR family DNA-binding domain-containing protein [Gemmatimonadales bacterium]
MSDIRALIVDDEPLARRGIRQLLAAHPDIVVVGECRDGREAVRALATMKPDLVFLDVQMPGLDGLGVVRVYGAERMPVTVFITAHDQFAVEAFDAQALDYLVKPLSEGRFREALQRVRERIRMHDAVGLAAKLSALLRGSADGHVAVNGTGRPSQAPVAVPTDTGELLLDQGEIDWIEAADDYAVIHAGGKSHRVRAALSALEARLDPARFTRIHRSSVVRLDRVREWKTDADDEMLLVLRDGTELPVSRRRAAQVKALLRPPGRRES